MKKYFVIKLAYDHGFWNELTSDFRGWFYATKYESNPILDYYSNPQFLKASSKKPVTIIEVYENE